jgi:hypothetical protein
MNALLRPLALLLALLVFAAGCSRTVYRTLGGAGLLPDDYRYGDLYRLSSLAAFKVERENCPKYAAGQSKVPVDLYVIGDSFLEKGRVDSTDFVARRYHYTHWEVPHDTIYLDRSVRNVLVLETVERHAREHFGRPVESLVVSPRPVPAVPEEVPNVWTDFLRFFGGDPAIRQVLPEERLENVLFNSPPAQVLKEAKAWVNARFFDRLNPSVDRSADGRYLLYGLDTDSTRVNSNFNALPESEVRQLVRTLNQSADAYRAAGFDAVYVSIIPNKTTLVANDPGRYNRLIERVQSDPALRVPVIDAYGSLRPLGPAAYEIGDSHWTCAGRNAWLGTVNRLLNSEIPSP